LVDYDLVESWYNCCDSPHD